ncbi:MAG: hypothetical protein GY777_07530 [Candidatus Brocadiaceae bacterium]|nr:hypothetical protein [Candidatus Brocadiaceae bacterium]
MKRILATDELFNAINSVLFENHEMGKERYVIVLVKAEVNIVMIESFVCNLKVLYLASYPSSLWVS